MQEAVFIHIQNKTTNNKCWVLIADIKNKNGWMEIITNNNEIEFNK